jgi:hypothetical protein
MPPLEPKKLIAGFLGLAAVTSSLVFWAAAHSSRPLPLAEEPKQPEPPKTAFVESYDKGGSALTEGLNLSDIFIDLAASELAAANPQGPQPDFAGTLSAALPDENALLAKFFATSSVYSDIFVLKNQAAPPTVTKKDMVLAGAGSDALAKYAAAVGEVEASLSHPNFLALLSRKEATPQVVNSIQETLDEAVLKLKKAPVPEKLVEFQGAFLSMLMHERKMLGSGNDDADLLRAAALYQLRRERLPEAIRAFQSASAKAKPLFAAATISGSSAGLFSIPTAHAIFGIGDIVFDPAVVAEMILEFSYKAIIETIKDRLVHRMVQQTITWIQGGGKPQFITNWKGFLKDAGNQAVGQVLDKVAPQLCQSFGPLIRISLAPVRTANYLDRDAYCTLDRVVQNVENFYTDFKEGGWIAYGASLDPKNNFLGAYFEASDLTAKLREEAELAAENEAASGSGFKDQKNCVKFEVVSPYDDCRARGGTVSACTYLQGQPGQRRCVEEQSTTPGSTAASVTGQSLLAPLHQIVNAQDLTALASALINSALNKLVSSAKGLLDPKIATPAPENKLPDPCDRLTGNAREECRANACANLTGELLKECRDRINEGDGDNPCTPGDAFCQNPDVCGTMGNDRSPAPIAEDLSNVQVIEGTDMTRWPVSATTTLDSVSFEGDNICLNHTPADFTWPDQADGQFKDVSANGWVFVWRTGKWHASPFEYYYRTGPESRCRPSGNVWDNVTIADFNPVAGERYGFMLSGLARAGHSNVQERTRVVMAEWRGDACVNNPTAGIQPQNP